MTVYKELELMDDDYMLSIEKKELHGFLPEKTIGKIPHRNKTVHPTSVWSDTYEVEACYLDDVFPLIIENGWRFINTYWKGGSSGDAHRVMTFIKNS